MFKHYLATAWRNFLRYKAVTAMNVLGLALGQACFIAAIGTLAYFNSADRHLPNHDRAGLVLMRYHETTSGLNGPLITLTTHAVAASMRKEFPELPLAFVYGGDTLAVDVDGHRALISAQVVDDEFFDIIDMPRAQIASGNPLRTPRTVVLTGETARRLFGDAQPIGRTLRLDGAMDVTVAAVLRPNSLPSHLLGPGAAVDLNEMIISRATQRALTEATTGKPFREPPLVEQWTGITFGSALYVQLPADGSLTHAQLEARLHGLAKRNGTPDFMKIDLRVVSLPKAWLRMLENNLFSGAKGLGIVELLFSLGVAALAVAIANYINISIAQARERAKETGLRRAIGASWTQLAGQPLIEIALHTLIAATLAALSTWIVARFLESRANLPLLSSVVHSKDFWLVALPSLLCLFALLIVSHLVGASLAQPSQALRANATQTSKGLAANILLGAQFVMTSVLVVVLIVIGAQSRRAHQLAAQASTDVLVTLDYRHRNGGHGYDTWRSELRRSPAVKGVTSATPPWQHRIGIFPLFTQQGALVKPNSPNVSYDFEKVLDHRILAGRAFGADFGDANVPQDGERPIMVDETLARALGFVNPTEAVGKLIRRGGYMAQWPPARIVGVVADKPMRLQPLMDFVGTAYLLSPYSDVIVRLDKNRVAEGLAAIDNVWRNLAPNEPVGREFSDESFAKVYAVYSLIGKVLTAITVVTLVIAMMGGFGLATFIANRRAHEIGVRKTLGANARQVFAMLLRDFSKPILIANVFGWPLAYIAAQNYLSTFEQPIRLSPWYFVAALVFTLLVAWVAISHQTWRAARLKPAEVLRHE
jgi:putative ABC transport system permease protein